ncbi:hypothetical protein GCM10009862_15630 [Microbacterium binotii]|uniref:Uncharacterized protein n=1 Tax=Microbacterium binotii TaxID=462710 RepID=A0ABN3PBF5_9MICO
MSCVRGTVPCVGGKRVSDEKLQQVTAGVAPIGLPQQAYGPEPMKWLEPRDRVQVRAWVQWPDRPAEQRLAVVLGMNDRVVHIAFIDPVGGERRLTVWRNAVRRPTATPPRT